MGIFFNNNDSNNNNIEDFYQNIDIPFFHPLCNVNSDRVFNRRSIRLLTYNIFLRPPPIKNNENDYKTERLLEFIDRLDDFDIVCLQEMFGTFTSRQNILISEAVKKGFFFYHSTDTPNPISTHFIDSGLVILSRFPIVVKDFTAFSYGVLSDQLAKKGILYTQIEVNNTNLHLLTTHLQASYFDSTEFKWNISFKARMDQIKEASIIVKSFLDQYYKSKNELVLLVGDFNVDGLSYINKKPTSITNFDDLYVEYDNLLAEFNKQQVDLCDCFYVKFR